MGIDIHGLPRPKLRGRLHLAAASRRSSGSCCCCGSPTAAWPTRRPGCTARPRCCSTSPAASYHVFTRSPRAMRVMQRVDHSMIYVLIAGTFTPFGLLVLDGGWRWASLAVMWSGALLGVVLTITAFDRYRKLVAALVHRPRLGRPDAAAAADRPPDPARAGRARAAASTRSARCCSRCAGRSSRPAGSATTRSGTSLVVAAGAVLYLANFALVRGRVSRAAAARPEDRRRRAAGRARARRDGPQHELRPGGRGARTPAGRALRPPRLRPVPDRRHR